jgi:hypothetical protein
MNDLFGSAIQLGLASPIIILIVLLLIGILEFLIKTIKLRRLNDQINFMVEEILLALIDLNGSVQPEKK